MDKDFIVKITKIVEDERYSAQHIYGTTIYEEDKEKLLFSISYNALVQLQNSIKDYRESK